MPISIHALLAESDGPMKKGQVYYINFYPRSPCGERRVEEVSGDTWTRDFYPRSPCGERPEVGGSNQTIINFYPRSPCGERLWLFRPLCS